METIVLINLSSELLLELKSDGSLVRKVGDDGLLLRDDQTFLADSSNQNIDLVLHLGAHGLMSSGHLGDLVLLVDTETLVFVVDSIDLNRMILVKMTYFRRVLGVKMVYLY